MKKILFAAVMVVVMTFASCGNQTKSAEALDSASVDTTVVDTIDTVAVDSIVK